MKNKIILILVLAILIVAAVFVGFNYRDFVLNRAEPENNTDNNGEIKIEDKTITDQTKPFNINIVYPYAAGLDEFNKKASDLVNEELNNFKEISLENDNAVKETDPAAYAQYPREYYLNISYDKGQIDQNVISIVFNISNYTGGAHGANYFSALNYDVKNKKFITLADLFPGQTDYLKNISDYCIENLKQQLRDRVGYDTGSWVKEGAGPTEENFSIFLINKNNIVFYFPQYQVAAYALGDFKVTIPR
jgi:hypothetical protein